MPIVSRAPATSLARLLSAYMAKVEMIPRELACLKRRVTGLQIRD